MSPAPPHWESKCVCVCVCVCVCARACVRVRVCVVLCLFLLSIGFSHKSMTPFYTCCTYSLHYFWIKEWRDLMIMKNSTSSLWPLCRDCIILGSREYPPGNVPGWRCCQMIYAFWKIHQLKPWWIITKSLREYQIFSAHLTAIKQVWLPRNTYSVPKVDGMSVLSEADDILCLAQFSSPIEWHMIS
jgi:hypothetical protein